MNIKTIYFLALIIIGASCTKVIDVDLNDSDPKLVVDAYVKYDPINNVQIAVVNLSKTANYFDSSIPEAITNATLSVINGEGKVFPLTYASQIGFYTNIVNPDISDTWTLEGTADNIDIKAETIIPSYVKIDSISSFEIPFGPPTKGTTPICFFTDIPGEKNFYRFKISVNNEEYNDLYYSGDEGQDGEQIAYPFFGVDVQDGDQMRIELLCIDEFSYEYYKVFGDNMGGGGFSAAPGNPNTNFENTQIVGIFTGQTSNITARTAGN